MTAPKADLLFLEGNKIHSAICQFYMHKRPKLKRAICYSQLYMLVAYTKMGKVTNTVNMTHLLKTINFYGSQPKHS